MNLTIGSRQISVDDAARSVGAYCRDKWATVLYYDLAGEVNGTVQPSDGIRLGDIGRMSFVNPRLSGNDVAAFVTRIAPTVDWTLVCGDARLEDAEPGNSNGLYEGMSRMWETVRQPGIAEAKVSKLLHMKRPCAFPILDSYVNATYVDRARERGRRDGATGPRGAVHPQFWLAIREDLLDGREAFDAIRERLDTTDAAEARGGRLPNLRMLDILAWQPRP